MAVQTQIQFRRGTAASWISSIILAAGELGLETDTGKYKIGDGTTIWSSLPYYVSSSSPAFTGTPTAPTATAGTNTTQIATTAFVNTAAYGVTSGFRNVLINGDFRVAQRGTSFTTNNGLNIDDTYTLDRWTLLSDGNGVVNVSQATDAPLGTWSSVALDVRTANKKFGIVQFVEFQNTWGTQGQTVTLSFNARVSGSSIGNVKAAVLAASTATADVVTSDVVSSWGADGVTPTWQADWTAQNTPANLGITTSWQRYTVTTTISSAYTKNLAVFIWCDDLTTSISDLLYITNIQLEVNKSVTPFEQRPIGVELELCMRYYEHAQAPLSLACSYAAGLGGNSYVSAVFFKVPKRITVSVINGLTDSPGVLRLWDGLNGTAGSVALYRGGWAFPTSITADRVSTHGFSLTTQGSTTDAAMAWFGYAFSAEL